LHFQQSDVVFQLQFTLFEPAQLQLVMMPVQGQQIYDRVEISMFHVEFDQAALDCLDIIHGMFPNGVLFRNLQECAREAHYNQKQFVARG